MVYVQPYASQGVARNKHNKQILCMCKDVWMYLYLHVYANKWLWMHKKSDAIFRQSVYECRNTVSVYAHIYGSMHMHVPSPIKVHFRFTNKSLQNDNVTCLSACQRTHTNVWCHSPTKFASQSSLDHSI